MSDPSETEAVGYKQPPNKTQFKPGQSGNPRGRPKRPKLDMSIILNNALNAKIVVTNLGTTKTGLEAFAQTTVDRVLQGDAKGIPDLMKLFDKAKAFKPVGDPTRLDRRRRRASRLQERQSPRRSAGLLLGWRRKGRILGSPSHKGD